MARNGPGTDARPERPDEECGESERGDMTRLRGTRPLVVSTVRRPASDPTHIGPDATTRNDA
jgi:hypothetical protein